MGPVYITGGVLHHSNTGSDVGLTHSSRFVSILMFGGGAGINISRILSFETNYYIPTSRDTIGGGLYITADGFRSKVYMFKDMIRFSLHLDWPL